MANVFIEEQVMTDIGNAIRSKTGGSDLILPADMASEIESISQTGVEGDAIVPQGTMSITENGEYDVTNYASANIDVPVGVFPEGTLGITENGTYDASEYASVQVDVPNEGITPTETISITENGTYDVTNAASAEVNVTGGNLESLAGATVASNANVAYMDLVEGFDPYFSIKGTSTKEGSIAVDDTICMTVYASKFGDAEPSDVKAGVTFTSKNGLKMTGEYDPTSGGLTMKTGTITVEGTDTESLTIDTGLSDVNAIIITHATPSSDVTYGWTYSWDTSTGMILYYTYSSAYVKTAYGANSTSKVTKDGGTVTASQHSSSYPVSSGTYTWVAYGTE